MWIPSKIVDLLGLVKDDIATLRAENSLLRSQLVVAQTNFDWARHRLNTLEFENKALMEVAYGVKVPSPEIVRQPKSDPTFDPKNFTFEDVGDEKAKEFGFPLYGDKA
jgi:hypothetical protein